MVRRHSRRAHANQPSARDIRARNEQFAKKARDTQGLRNSKGENKRGLVHRPAEVAAAEEPEKKQPGASSAVKYLAIFLIFVLLGGCTYARRAYSSHYGIA